MISAKKKKESYKCYMLFPGLYNLKVQNKIEGLTLTDLFDTVCRFYNVSGSEVKNGGRRQEIKNIRQHYCFFAKKYTYDKLEDIGAIVGRDHATVIHAIKMVENGCLTDRKYKNNIRSLNAFIRERHQSKKK